MTRLVPLICLVVCAGCGGAGAGSTGARSPKIDVDELERIHAELETARQRSVIDSAKRVDIPEGGAEPGEVPPDGPRRFAQVGDRRIAFAEAVTMICGPVDMAAIFARYTEALSLFDPVESEKIGRYLGWIQGGLSLVGAGVAAFGLSKGSDGEAYQGTGALIIGLGGLSGGLKSLGKGGGIAQEAFVRLSFNRELGILLRQYTPAIGEAKHTCDASLRAWQTEYQAEENQKTDEIPSDRMKALKAALAKLSLVHDGLVKIGSAAGEMYDEMTKKNVAKSSKVYRNLGDIKTETATIKANWAADQVQIEAKIECIAECLSQ